MKKVKIRKPRGRKKNGHRSYDLCLGCYYPHCDPEYKRPPKVNERLSKNLCPGCGHNPCTCRSSLLLRYRSI